MKQLFTLFAISVLLASCGGVSKSTVNDLATSNPITVQINLSEVSDDKVPVTVDPGRFTQETVVYRLPKVVQGTYAISDFGKYIDDIKAVDYDGNALTISKLDDNSWSISDATKLDKVTYFVNDTFDQETVGGIGEEVPFSPSGTNIEPDNFVLNLHGFVGYFDSLKTNQYAIDITSPATFTRASALQETGLKSGPMGKNLTTSYFANRYFDVTDNPMMFGNLTSEEFPVGNITVGLHVYSPNGTHTASTLKDVIYTMMQAQKAYLGDLNATDRYDIFLYLSRGDETAPKGFGALEHHRSTVVVFPEDTPPAALAESLTDVVSHEFFHIVSPLTLHSEDVHYFDYHKPTFSKHLWLYEGVTEYFANHFQVHEGLIEPAEFYARMMDKINYAKSLDDTMSFTLMSENVTEAPYKDNYLNVYQKGALIGMCIDIIMREESNGERGILSLMKELSNKYGIDKPFEDDKLFDEVTAMTYPSIGEFFKTHVEGTTPIDYNVYFAKAGLKLTTDKVKTNYIMNGMNFIFMPEPATQSIKFGPLVADNSFWVENGVQEGDKLVSVNGEKITFQNAQQIFTEMYMWQPDTEIDLTLSRDGEEFQLKTTTTQSYTTGESLVPDDNATQAQIDLRTAWLKG
jgi:predicted metalloprotease with PDZ domain